MLKVDGKLLQEMESHFSGIVESIRCFDEARLPACPRCRSNNTADVLISSTGRMIYIAAATTKVKLIPNLPKPGNYFCNKCEKFFN
jgi:hypothetical protein